VSALRDRIIEKTIEFRDKSKSLSGLIPKQMFDNKPNREEIDKKLQAQKVQDGVKEIQDITTDLFELLDELDVIEGTGLQR
jgi:hypothetical protein